MKAITYFFIIFATTLLSGCVGYYSDMSHLSDDDLKWTDCYNIGDTLIFESTNHYADTLVVDSKSVNNSKNPLFIHFIDDYMGDKYYATASYGFHIKSQNGNLKGWLKLKKLIENDSITWSAGLGERMAKQWHYVFDFKEDKKTYIGQNPVKATNITLYGSKFDTCLVIDENNSRLMKYVVVQPTTIKSFVISKQYGLIQFKLETGTEFFRRDLFGNE